jgi:hypothetical protein
MMQQVAVGASGCDPTKWCAAMNIFSLAQDPVNGTVLNPTCQAKTGLEYVNFAGNCRFTGVGCTLIPTTDKGTPAAFYPFFSAFQHGVHNEQGNGRCMWGFGNDLPGATTDFGRNAQYGALLSLTYLAVGGHGACGPSAPSVLARWGWAAPCVRKSQLAPAPLLAAVRGI